jgi:hypothetical protein
MSADILQQLVDERGGAAAMTTVQLAACRSMAKLLSDDSADAGTIARAIPPLEALLPPPLAPKVEEAPPNWAALTDAEFHMLDRLCAKLRDEKAPPARRRVRQQRWKTLRSVCLFVDEAERRNLPLTDTERHELRGLIRDALKPVIAFELLFSELSARPAPMPEPEPIPELEPEPEELPPPPDTQNVVSLRPDPDTAGLKYGAFYTGSGGTGGHFGDNPPGR